MAMDSDGEREMDETDGPRPKIPPYAKERDTVFNLMLQWKQNSTPKYFDMFISLSLY